MFLSVLMTLPPEGQERFLRLWEAVRANLVKYIRRKLDGVSTYKDCEDILEDAFVRVMEQYGRYGGLPDEELRAILIRTCDNLCRNERRRSGRIGFVSLPAEYGVTGEDLPAEDTIRTPEDLVVSESNAAHIREIIRTLPRAEGEILQMRILEELSYREIAEQEKITESAARQRFKRAREDVIRRLKEEGYDHESENG